MIFDRDKKINYEKYYADKVSFLKTLLKTIRRMIVLFFWYIVMAIPLASNDNESTLAGITMLWLIGNLGLFINFIYFIFRCFKENNLRL